MVVSTSGETVVLPCVFSVMVTPYQILRPERSDECSLRNIVEGQVHANINYLDTVSFDYAAQKERACGSAQDEGINLHHCHAAIHAEDLAGDVRGFV
jgi:predicted aldo/keto reductase-like oxidoreductase